MKIKLLADQVYKLRNQIVELWEGKNGEGLVAIYLNTAISLLSHAEQVLSDASAHENDQGSTITPSTQGKTKASTGSRKGALAGSGKRVFRKGAL